MNTEQQNSKTGGGAASRVDYHKQYENEQRANRACGIYHGEYWAKRAIASVLDETGIELHFEHVINEQCRIYRKFGYV